MNKNNLHAGHRERMRKRFEEDGFGLALLTDLKLGPQTAECLYLMVQDELCNIMKTG